MNTSREHLPEEAARKPNRGIAQTLRNIAGYITIGVGTIIAAGQIPGERQEHHQHASVAGLKQKQEGEAIPLLTKEAAKQAVIERVQLETYENVMNTVGVQCGDGRNPEGIPAFGGELMGIAY